MLFQDITPRICRPVGQSQYRLSYSITYCAIPPPCRITDRQPITVTPYSAQQSGRHHRSLCSNDVVRSTASRPPHKILAVRGIPLSETPKASFHSQSRGQATGMLSIKLNTAQNGHVTQRTDTITSVTTWCYHDTATPALATGMRGSQPIMVPEYGCFNFTVGCLQNRSKTVRSTGASVWHGTTRYVSHNSTAKSPHVHNRNWLISCIKIRGCQ